MPRSSVRTLHRAPTRPLSILQRVQLWWPIIAANVARVMLYTAVSLVAYSSLPSVIGWIPTTIMSDSMGPRIRAGDVVVAMPVDTESLRIGQVLLVDDPDHDGRLRLHRMVGVSEAGSLILQGDANVTADNSSVGRQSVRGVGVIRVPFVGLPGLWVHDREVIPLIIFVGAAVGLLLATRLDRHLLKPVDGTNGTPPGHDPPVGSTSEPVKPARLRPRPALTFVAIAVMATASLSIGSATASAGFFQSTANPTSNLSADTAYPCLSPAVPADAPFFYYRFTEQSGTTATDSSGNGRDGTLQGDADRAPGSCSGAASPALALSGVSGYVSTATALAGPDVFSLELWFRTAAGYAQGGRLIGFGNAQVGESSSYDRHIYMDTAGKIHFGVYPGGSRLITSPLSYNTGAWTHVVATLSTAGMCLYVDGALVASDSAVTAGQVYSGYWRIGYDNLSGWPPTPPQFSFQGNIDNAAVYTTALTDAQVVSHRDVGH